MIMMLKEVGKPLTKWLSVQLRWHDGSYKCETMVFIEMGNFLLKGDGRDLLVGKALGGGKILKYSRYNQVVCRWKYVGQSDSGISEYHWLFSPFIVNNYALNTCSLGLAKPWGTGVTFATSVYPMWPLLIFILGCAGSRTGTRSPRM